jgi:hypothetical protein
MAFVWRGKTCLCVFYFDKEKNMVLEYLMFVIMGWEGNIHG